MTPSVEEMQSWFDSNVSLSRCRSSSSRFAAASCPGVSLFFFWTLSLLEQSLTSAFYRLFNHLPFFSTRCLPTTSRINPSPPPTPSRNPLSRNTPTNSLPRTTPPPPRLVDLPSPPLSHTLPPFPLISSKTVTSTQESPTRRRRVRALLPLQ